MSSEVKRAEMSWLGMEAPRYTSYPSAHHFTRSINADTQQNWLRTIDRETTVSAYVHIPFCRELCWFCGCHTKMTKRYEPISRYVQVLLKEIRMTAATTGGRGRLKNIHFGGGSPSLLEAGDLMAILYALAEAFQFDAPDEFAIELDPRTTTQEMIKLYAALGFNRVSIGIQDFDPVVQRAINRIQPYAMVAEKMAALRKAGLSAINCDLIYGLPHQTPASFETTLEKTIRLAPSRVALFSYAHVPQIKKHQRLIKEEDLPSDREKLGLFTEASRILQQNGYVAIGIDHFARFDDPLAIAMKNHGMVRNFQGYTTDPADVLLGFGSSAISQFPQGYTQNSAQGMEYRSLIEGGGLATVRGWAFQADDTARKQVIDELMCYMEVDLAAISEKFSLGPGYFAVELRELTQPCFGGIVQIDGNQIRVTTPHRMAARVVAAVFDHYRHLPSGRYSKVA